jgi:hypothetical protein
MKKLLFLILFIVSASAVNAQNTTKTMIYDDAVTVTNDTLESGWFDIKDYSLAELYVAVGDSLSLGTTFTVYYRAGAETGTTYLPYSSDTASVSNIGASTSEETGKVLRGSTANNIPGANTIKVRAIRKDYSVGVTSSLHIYLVLRQK